MIHETEERERPPAAGGRRVSGKAIGAGLALAGTVVALVTGLTGLADWIAERLDPPPPAVVDAEVSRPELRSTRQRLVDYLRETRQPTTGLAAYEGREEGRVFTVRLRLEGNRGSAVRLRWTVVDARTGEPLEDPTYTQDAAVFRPRSDSQSRRWPMWVPYPEELGTYRLRVTLLDERSQPLDEAESATFEQVREPPL